MHKILFYNKFISCLYMFRTLCAHHQEVKIVLYSIWYHHTCRWPSRAQVERACKTGTTPTHPHRNSNTHRTKNNTTNVVIEQNSRKLLMMDILISETCWAHKKWNKIASGIKLVLYSSTITMMHGPINIRFCAWSWLINYWDYTEMHGQQNIKIKYVFRVSLQLLSETFFHS